MAARKFRKFSEGGEAADKEAGLKASKDENVGFLARMRMGNIDDPNSEAYKRFGAGRGKAERTPVEDRVATPAPKREPAKEAPVKTEAPKEDAPSSNMRKRAEEQGETKSSGDASVAEMYQGPRKEPVSSAPAKTPAKAPVKSEAKAPVKAESKAPVKAESKAPAAAESKSKSLVDQIPRDKATPVSGEKVDSTELGRNINNALNATPGIQAVGRLKSAGQAAQKAGSRAVSTAVDDGVTFLGKSGRRQVGGFDELGAAAKQLADNRKAAIARESAATLANNPTKRIGGPSKGDLLARDRAAREAKRRAEMGETNAARYGLDPKAPDYADRAKTIRDSLGGGDFSLGMKKGGSVKGWGMARGARKAKIV